MSYTVLPNGIIALSGSAAILLSTSEEARFKTNVIDRWSPLASSFSNKYGVPLSWILSIIYAESLGNPNAVNAEVPPGLGLMQITDPGLKRGLSDAQVLDPATNLDIGVSFLSRIMKLGNRDLPSVASYYNCGGHSDGSPHTAPTSGQNPAWGLCATAGYLERVTSTNNTYLAKYASTPANSSGFPWKPMVGAGLIALAVRWALK